MRDQEHQEPSAENCFEIDTNGLTAHELPSTPAVEVIVVDGRCAAAASPGAAAGSPGPDVILVSESDPMTDLAGKVPWLEPFEIRRPMHPFRAGYRTPAPRQNLILVLSVLAGFTVCGVYIYLSMPPWPNNVPARPASRDFFSDENATLLIGIVLFFGTIYATGMGLYRYVGDPEGGRVVSANAGQHMPLLFLLAGGLLSFRHGEKVLARSGRDVDWLLLAIGLALLALSAWGLYRATVVHRTFYQWFYGLRKDRPSGKPFTTALYDSLGMRILTRIVVFIGGANLLGAVEVILLIGPFLMFPQDRAHTNLTLNQIYGGTMGLVVALIDAAWRWGQPRAGHIQRWFSPYEGGCVVFVPGWVIGICFTGMAVWAGFQGFR
jgi:hypothetical protein